MKTPADGTPALIADQLTRDADQDRDLRALRRRGALAIAVGVVGFLIALAAHLRPRPSQPQTPPALHLACPAAPAATCAPTLTCAACPACPAPRSSHRD